MSEPFTEGFQGSGGPILEEPFKDLVDSMLGGIQSQKKAGNDTNSCQLVFTHPDVDGNLLFTLSLLPGSLHNKSVDEVRQAVDEHMNPPDDTWR